MASESVLKDAFRQMLLIEPLQDGPVLDHVMGRRHEQRIVVGGPDERVGAQGLDCGSIEAGRGNMGRERSRAPHSDELEHLFARPSHGGRHTVAAAYDLSPVERAEFALCLRKGFLGGPWDTDRLVENEGVAQDVAQSRALERNGEGRIRDLRFFEFSVIERRHADNRVVDAMRLQKARAHLFDRVVAAREHNAQAAVVGRQRHEVRKRVARCLLKQALDAFYKDDLAVLRTEDRAKFRPVRRHLRGAQRGVQMRLCEFLDAKAKQEMIRGEHADGVLAHGRLAAASRSGHEHDLSALERVENLLNESSAWQMKIVPEPRAYSAQDRFGVIGKRLEHAAFVPTDHVVARQRGSGQVIAAQAATGYHRRARLYDQFVPGSAGARLGVSVRRREGEHAPDVRFRLSRRAVEVEAQARGECTGTARCRRP